MVLDRLMAAIVAQEYPLMETRSRCPIFELSEVIKWPGGPELFCGTTPRRFVGFLWRLSPPAFWDQVKLYRLPVYEDLESGIIGLILETGGSAPRCIAYDRDLAVEAFSRSYIDSSRRSESKRKYLARGFFEQQIQALDLGPGTPFFLIHHTLVSH